MSSVRGIDRSEYPVMQGVERAMAVLEHLASQQRPCGPSEIARNLGFSKPAVVRLLQTWTSLGYVERTEGSYELGWKILVLAHTRSAVQEIHRAARRYMVWLNERSGETIHLAVLRDSEVIYIDKIEGRRSIRVHGDVGRAGSIYATASGKAMLAYLPSSIADPLISRPLVAWTDTTIVDATELRVHLAMSRERGYSVNSGEWHEKVGGVGAAIFSRDGNVEAALSILYPLSEAGPDRVAQLGRMVKHAAEHLSVERGWSGSATSYSAQDADELYPTFVPMSPADGRWGEADAGDRLEPVG